MSNGSVDPIIISYFFGDPIGKLLSNFANTPFVLDEMRYEMVEGFWQSLKTEDDELRLMLAQIPDGTFLKRAGQKLAQEKHSQLFTYQRRLYRTGSEAHHILLNRAIRAKVQYNPKVRTALLESGDRLLKHVIPNRYGVWHVANSPTLPAIVFENILGEIRAELQTDTFRPILGLPDGIDTSRSENG